MKVGLLLGGSRLSWCRLRTVRTISLWTRLPMLEFAAGKSLEAH